MNNLRILQRSAVTFLGVVGKGVTKKELFEKNKKGGRFIGTQCIL